MKSAIVCWKSQIKKKSPQNVSVKIANSALKMGDLTPLIDGPVKYRDGKKVKDDSVT